MPSTGDRQGLHCNQCGCGIRVDTVYSETPVPTSTKGSKHKAWKSKCQFANRAGLSESSIEMTQWRRSGCWVPNSRATPRAADAAPRSPEKDDRQGENDLAQDEEPAATRRSRNAWACGDCGGDVVPTRDGSTCTVPNMEFPGSQQIQRTTKHSVSSSPRGRRKSKSSDMCERERFQCELRSMVQWQRKVCLELRLTNSTMCCRCGTKIPRKGGGQSEDEGLEDVAAGTKRQGKEHRQSKDDWMEDVGGTKRRVHSG